MAVDVREQEKLPVPPIRFDRSDGSLRVKCTQTAEKTETKNFNKLIMISPNMWDICLFSEHAASHAQVIRNAFVVVSNLKKIQEFQLWRRRGKGYCVFVLFSTTTQLHKSQLSCARSHVKSKMVMHAFVQLLIWFDSIDWKNHCGCMSVRRRTIETQNSLRFE